MHFLVHFGPPPLNCSFDKNNQYLQANKVRLPQLISLRLFFTLQKAQQPEYVDKDSNKSVEDGNSAFTG